MARPVKIGIWILVVTALLVTVARWRSSPPAPEPSRRSLVASLRSEPLGYNRYVESTAASEVVSLLTDARLIRVNRANDAVEPALAESWTQSPDGLTYTFQLRRNVKFSDGTPFTSADVVFSARAMYDPRVASQVASAMQINGKPLVVTAPDDLTVTVTLPASFAPGLRLFDNMPILPRHKLEAALDESRFTEAWRVGTPLTALAGLGPFVLTEHVAGQRLVFSRNPHYWRRDDSGAQLPHLDGLTLSILPDQNTEALRMGAGELDLMVNGDIRPDDYATFKRASDEGKLRLIEAGIGLDPNLLWFNLSDATKDRVPWLRDRRVRQAISYAVNRQALVDTVYLGAAVPIYGPVSPGNRTWTTSSAPQYPYDVARARELLAAAGLTDRNADSALEDAGGKPVRFSMVTHKGHTLRERSASVIQAHLRQVGIAVDLVALDVSSLRERWMTGDYESIFFGVQASATDPALNPDFWLSSGDFHFWNPGQKTPATEWEAEIDRLMQRQASARSLEERQQLFADVQRIIGEELPAIYFVAPRVTIAVSPRLVNPQPVLQIPQLLWSADTLNVKR